MTGNMSTEEVSPWKLGIRERLRQVNPVFCVMVVCFAVSAWIDLLGLRVELPIMVRVLPEKWSLPSYGSIISNCAVLSPLIYMLIVRSFSHNRQRREFLTCYVIMFIGAAGCVVLAFVWNKTVFVNGKEHSIPLFIINGVLFVAHYLCPVVYYPFMDRFKPHYMPYYIAGEELGGMIAGITGLVQGVGADVTCVNTTFSEFDEEQGLNVTGFRSVPIVPEPRFSVKAFFLFDAAILCLSIISFSLMNFTSIAKKEMVIKEDEADRKSGSDDDDPQELEYLDFNNSNNETDGKPLKRSGSMNEDEQDLDDVPEKASFSNENENSSLQDKGKCRNRKRPAILLVVGAITTFMVFGLNPSLQPFACLPYGSLAYTLAVRLCTMINPFAALLAFFVPTNSVKKITACCATGCAIVVYFIYLAVQSPSPPLQHHPAGTFLVIFLSIVATTTLTYARVNIVSTVRLEGGPNGTMYAGFALQFGSTLGGIIAFLLVNVGKFFESMPLCPT